MPLEFSRITQVIVSETGGRISTYVQYDVPWGEYVKDGEMFCGQWFCARSSYVTVVASTTLPLREYGTILANIVVDFECKEGVFETSPRELEVTQPGCVGPLHTCLAEWASYFDPPPTVGYVCKVTMFIPQLMIDAMRHVLRYDTREGVVEPCRSVFAAWKLYSCAMLSVTGKALSHNGLHRYDRVAFLVTNFLVGFDSVSDTERTSARLTFSKPDRTTMESNNLALPSNAHVEHVILCILWRKNYLRPFPTGYNPRIA